MAFLFLVDCADITIICAFISNCKLSKNAILGYELIGY